MKLDREDINRHGDSIDADVLVSASEYSGCDTLQRHQWFASMDVLSEGFGRVKEQMRITLDYSATL